MMWASMLKSSVWLTTSKETKLVWVTLLLMKDADGIVRSGIPGIAHEAVLTIPEVENALKELSGPDKYTNTQEHEGRRVKRVSGGWLILNHEKYRTSADMQAKWRQQKANQRARAAEMEDTGEVEEAVTGLKGRTKDDALSALNGFSGTTGELNEELKRIHGSEPQESEATKQARIGRVNAKIAREEAMEAEVREKFNPGATGERSPAREGEEGLTAREIVKKRVAADLKA